MSPRSVAVAAAFAAGLLLPAAADAAYTTGAVNVRAGPGTNYYVIATAPRGAYVSVHNCWRSWCKVNYRGILGWMSAGYIASGKPRYYPRYAYKPPVYFYPRPIYPYPYVWPHYYRGLSYGFWFSFRG